MWRRDTIWTDIRPFKKYEVTDPATNAAVSTTILDTYSLIIITTTGASNAQTLQSPAVVTNSTRITIANNDTSTNAITINWTSLEAWNIIEFVWDGSAWVSEATATWWDTLPIVDTTAVVKWSVDATKLVRIEADWLTAWTTRVATMPDKDITIMDSAWDDMTWALNTAKGSDIASATTTDLSTATWNFVDITGTTTITGLWTVTAWAKRTLQFDWILILTHNASSLILPTGTNITTAAWDTCEMISLWSGNWVCTNYQRADWTALASAWWGGWSLNLQHPHDVTANFVVIWENITNTVTYTVTAWKVFYITGINSPNGFAGNLLIWWIPMSFWFWWPSAGVDFYLNLAQPMIVEAWVVISRDDTNTSYITWYEIDEDLTYDPIFFIWSYTVPAWKKYINLQQYTGWNTNATIWWKFIQFTAANMNKWEFDISMNTLHLPLVLSAWDSINTTSINHWWYLVADTIL